MHYEMSQTKAQQPIVKSIPTQSFYGAPSIKEARRYKVLEQQRNVGKPCLSRKPLRILGPSNTWRVFKRQNAALDFARLKRSELMIFVYQQISCDRVFVVAHPRVYWQCDIQREQNNRCSYEVIQEHSVCKLYFDLEYETTFNLNKNGGEMVETFIKIVNFWLRYKWSIFIDRSHILDLDSTTGIKFSRHLIFQLPNAAFCDNYAVGNFVKTICSHLRNYISGISSDSDNVPTTWPTVIFTEVDGYLQTIGSASLRELFVLDSKGNTKLFCDEAVYTKNRHFRIYCSTKRNKNAPLFLSPENQFTSLSNEDLFLHSLITYFPHNKCDLGLLDFNLNNAYGAHTKIINHQDASHHNINIPVSSYSESPHPEIDKFISSIVVPGRIWRWVYFSSSNLMVYDIIGYRYCSNIARQHRSNGIKYIVNLTNQTYYQKCYDPECMGYRSTELKLPLEIAFFYEDEQIYTEGSIFDNDISNSTLSSLGIVEYELAQVLDAVEIVNNLEKSQNQAIVNEKHSCQEMKEATRNSEEISGNVDVPTNIFTDEGNQELISVLDIKSDVTDEMDVVREVDVCEEKQQTNGTCNSNSLVFDQDHFTNEELIQVSNAVEEVVKFLGCGFLET